MDFSSGDLGVLYWMLADRWGAFISASLLQTALIPWVGLGLILGNRLPCFHQFRGGKGVANYLGFSAFIAPLWALAAILAWLISYTFYRIAFIGSLIMV